MTLNEIRHIIGQFAFRDLRPEEFDTLIDGAQREHFTVTYNAKDWESLRPFKVVKGDGTPPLYVTNGQATLPSDFFAFESMYAITDGTPVQIEALEDEEFDMRRGNFIEFPTLEYPIANFQAATVRFLPKTIQYVMFSYFKTPATTHFGTTSAQGFVEYDPLTSTELEWDEKNQVSIILIALRYLGIEATREQVEKQKK